MYPLQRPRTSGAAVRSFWERKSTPSYAIGLIALCWTVLFYLTATNNTDPQSLSPLWLLAAAMLHVPYLLILVLLAFGSIERIGYFWRGRSSNAPGSMPAVPPTVCVQLPMFNEHAVARRIIEAAAALDWPTHRLSVQVLDDSTDPATRDMVRAICAEVEARTGVFCQWLHRADRAGYKAGALEAGRRVTDAEFIVIFDADFVPPPHYLCRMVPHFFNGAGVPLRDLAVVQAQWGHLNDDESLLTGAQALWVDDHHSLQMAWRSAALGFVNFTGTAGIWRAQAIEDAGGWRSASLVEDCELSFRALFAGYRTKFVKDVVVPAELPQTFAAYRSQQKRWTQGWAQLQRLHLAALLRFPMPLRRKAFLTYMMCISWQWPLWAAWIALFPFLIANGLSLSALGVEVALAVYLLPPLAFAVFAAWVATVETKVSYAAAVGMPRQGAVRRFARVLPYLVINAGMLPHHLCAFVEGLLGPMHAEFERTPKTASVTAAPPVAERPDGNPTVISLKRRVKRPAYAAVEVAFLVAQLAWIALFLHAGLLFSALGGMWLAGCIAAIRLVQHAPASPRLRVAATKQRKAA